MGCRSSLVALALLVAPACRLHFDSISTGGAWTAEGVQSLTAGADGRADVLRRLGPPDAVTYTLTDEVFFYRRGGHRGSELRLLIPDPLVNLLRPGLEQLTPEEEQAEEFDDQAPPVAVTQTLIDRAFGLLNPVSSEEALALQGRRLRWDVARIVLDRETHVTRAIDLFLGIEAAEARSLWRDTFLLGPGSPEPSG